MTTELIFTETDGHKGTTSLHDHGARVRAQLSELFGATPVRICSSSIATCTWEDFNVRYSSVTVVEIDLT